MKLKTLKDLTWINSCEFEMDEEDKMMENGMIWSHDLKQEAIKWIKHYIKTNGIIKKLAFDNSKDEIESKIEWIKHFFNITEEDLK